MLQTFEQSKIRIRFISGNTLKMEFSRDGTLGLDGYIEAADKAWGSSVVFRRAIKESVLKRATCEAVLRTMVLKVKKYWPLVI